MIILDKKDFLKIKKQSIKYFDLLNLFCSYDEETIRDSFDKYPSFVINDINERDMEIYSIDDFEDLINKIYKYKLDDTFDEKQIESIMYFNLHLMDIYRLKSEPDKKKVYTLVVNYCIYGESGLELYTFDSKEKALQEYKNYIRDEKEDSSTWIHDMLDLCSTDVGRDIISYDETDESFRLQDFDNFEDIYIVEQEVK